MVISHGEIWRQLYFLFSAFLDISSRYIYTHTCYGFYNYIRFCLLAFMGFFLSIPIFPSLKSPTLHTRQAAYLRPSVRPPIDNFRRGVEWAPTERLQELVLLVQVGKPKVRNLQREVRPGEPVSTAVSVCASSAHTSQTRASEVLAGPARLSHPLLSSPELSQKDQFAQLGL